MCLIFLAVQAHPKYKLVLAGNRDEFYNRKTAPAQFWKDYPQVVGGRDLEAGGTWLGMSREGRIAMVTNYRDPQKIDPKAPSRGHLVSDFLIGNQLPKAYLEEISNNGKRYNGFNLILGTVDELWYYSNYKMGIEKISNGLHGLSNHLLDTSWPKVLRGKERINPMLASDDINPDQLFDALFDDERAVDELLPNTGLTIDRERALSSMFIKSEGYGSRCSTIILVDKSNEVTFVERAYNVTNFTYTTQKFQFKLPS
jgi:uncharacterized protein with NRDE domain